MPRLFRNTLLVVLSAVFSSSLYAAAAKESDTLNVALLPDENAGKVIQDNDALKAHLEARTGKKVKLHVLTSYAAMVEATRNGQIDLAFFGPLSYCIAKDKAAIEPFAAKLKNGTTTYNSVIIVAADSPIKTIADLKGKRVGFGDPASTSSHLIPKGMIAKAGLEHGKDYQESFLGKHDIVALNVARGNVDAGGLSKPIFEGLLEKRTIDKTKVRVLAESAPIPEYPWVYQASLSPELKTKIRAAFLEVKDPAVLTPLKADGFAAIEDDDYDVIRDAAKILRLDLGTLEK
jgi:phosphonate transport system substrate-binding protein